VSVTLATEPDLARGAYALKLLLFRLPSWDLVPARGSPARDAAASPAIVGPIVVLPRSVPGAARPIGATFGDAVELVGVERLERIGPAVHVVLHWRARRQIERDYSVFVHVVDEQNRLVEQADGHPWGGALPTTAWPSGEVIVDERQVWVPPAVGPLRVLTGLYRLDTGERLRAASDHVDLGTLGPAMS
jgi:hypothetical protein